MKPNKMISMACLLASLSGMQAANIVIPDGSMEGSTATMNPPFLLGTNKGNIGAWTAEMTGLLSLGGYIKSGTASALSGPPAADGTNELKINLPANVAASATLSQILTNDYYLPNSTYTFSVALDQGTTLNLVSGTALSLNAGTTTLASLSGATLVNLLDNANGFQTVTLTYKTGNTAPTNAIGIAFTAGGVASVGGNIYVDNFQLAVNPIQVRMDSAVVTSGTNLVINGSGGAAGATYEIVTTTNLVTPNMIWVPAMTNTFDANGKFDINFKVDENTPSRFFRLMLPE